jgi:predicted AAA+ superfamily ATPase
MARGGFPELYRNLELDSREFFQSYVATYLDRDVRLALRVGSLRDFERFVRACAIRSGQLLNLTELARDVGIAGSTARDWVSVLEASNQILLLEPYFANVGKRLVKTPKLYFRDSGLLCFLLGLESPAAMESSASIGAIWESYVVEQIVKARAACGSAAELFFWRDAHGTEVDLAIEHEGRVRLVEVKYAESVEPARMRSIVKVDKELGPRAAGEHWVACRTPHSHRALDEPAVRLVNGFTFDKWFDGDPRRSPG